MAEHPQTAPSTQARAYLDVPYAETKNPDGAAPTASSTYRLALYRWLARCDIRDTHGRPVQLTPHQWRHTLGTRLINRDVPQEVVRRILDHDSPRRPRRCPTGSAGYRSRRPARTPTPA